MIFSKYQKCVIISINYTKMVSKRMSFQNYKKEPYFMSFYKNIAILNQVYNVETKFLTQLMAQAGTDMIVHLNSNLKEKIMVEIGSGSANPAKAANKHLNSLKRKGVITSAGRGSYMINPKVHGYTAAHESIVNKTAQFIELKIKHSSDGSNNFDVKTINKETGEATE